MSKIEAKSQAILDSSVTSQNEIRECQNKLNHVSIELRGEAAGRARMYGRIDRLVQICAGMKVEFEDFRKLSGAHHAGTALRLRSLRRDQSRGFAVTISQSRSMSSSMRSLEDIVRQLVILFGSFSSAVLNLLKRTLKTDLEIYALLREVHSTMLRQPLLAREDSIEFTGWPWS